jgi:predicted transcriptional regulator
MATTKVTYTLDEATVRFIEEAAEIQHKPKSQVIRDAVKDYRARIGRLSESERQRRLEAFDRLYPLIKLRTRQQADAELKEIRESRRLSGLSREI